MCVCILLSRILNLQTKPPSLLSCPCHHVDSTWHLDLSTELALEHTDHITHNHPSRIVWLDNSSVRTGNCSQAHQRMATRGFHRMVHHTPRLPPRSKTKEQEWPIQLLLWLLSHCGSIWGRGQSGLLWVEGIEFGSGVSITVCTRGTSRALLIRLCEGYRTWLHLVPRGSGLLVTSARTLSQP